MEKKTSLSELRKEIDSIDNDIFLLLERRLNVVKKVGEYKNKYMPDASIIRSGREALMVRSIFSRAKDAGFDDRISLAFSVLWRNIISLSVNLEEATSISVFAEREKVTSLAREYFGVFTDVFSIECEGDHFFDSLVSGKSSISVFEVEEECTSKPWWVVMAEGDVLDDYAIFAGLPFFEGGKLDAVCVAKVSPEVTGDDRFLYCVEGDVYAKLQGVDDGIEVLSQYEGYKLISSGKELTMSDIPLKYLGCVALF